MTDRLVECEVVAYQVRDASMMLLLILLTTTTVYVKRGILLVPVSSVVPVRKIDIELG